MKTIIDAGFINSDIRTVPFTGNLKKQISSLRTADLLKKIKTLRYIVTKSLYNRSDAHHHHNDQTAKGLGVSTYNII